MAAEGWSRPGPSLAVECHSRLRQKLGYGVEVIETTGPAFGSTNRSKIDADISEIIQFRYQGGFMNYKRLFFVAFYLVVGFVLAKDVTAFDRTGVVELRSTSQDPPNPNMRPNPGK